MLRSFSLTVSTDGSVTAGIDVDAVEGLADTGNLGDDLTDLLVALGEAAQDGGAGVAFLVDEVQFLQAAEFEALIAALHRTVQRQLPITFVGAGLPQLPRLAGEAKSYAERLFTFPRLGRLSDVEAEAALTHPAAELGGAFEPGAIDAIVAYTEGYPYFVQEYGKFVWDMAPEGEPIAESVAREAQRAVEAKLDESFFRVRAERTTELELRYLRAAAELGPGPHAAGDVAAVLGRTSEQLGPTRARLIDKGPISTTGHGRGDFTVPQFDRTCGGTTSCSMWSHMATRMGIRELRDNLTAAVRRVRAGETIEVTSDGEPVALLTPVPRTRRERLIAEGRLIPARNPSGPLPAPTPARPGAPSTEEIIADDRGG